MAILGENLRRIRKAAGLTQAQVAEKLGILAHNYVPFETGKKLPADETLKRIAEILDTSYKVLLTYKEADEIQKKYSRDAIRELLKSEEGLAAFQTADEERPGK